MTRFTLTLWISFFILLAITNCQKRGATVVISIISDGNKSVGLSIKGVDIRESEISTRLKIQLVKDEGQPPVLGEFKSNGDEIIFEPLVPFTIGLQYQVLLDDSLLSEIGIPLDDHIGPELVSIYPTQDTLPANLLKIYLQFSQPMVEGRSLDYLTLMRSDGDTMKGTFLDLQPELWNVESTVLTLWLDPGRIKRDLIPNKEMGAPLHVGEKYILHISPLWRSKNGAVLLRSYEKSFVAVSRDETSPDLLAWVVKSPVAGSMYSLEITTPEPIDYFLFRDAVRILTSEGQVLRGDVQISNNEKVWKFLPEKAWTKGKYILQAEGRLEDLAGNNLNRPFDREVENVHEQSEQDAFTKEFEIR
jgi:hypothetical protein